MAGVAVALATKAFLYKRCIDLPSSMVGEQQQWVVSKSAWLRTSAPPYTMLCITSA